MQSMMIASQQQLMRRASASAGGTSPPKTSSMDAHKYANKDPNTDPNKASSTVEPNTPSTPDATTEATTNGTVNDNAAETTPLLTTQLFNVSQLSTASSNGGDSPSPSKHQSDPRTTPKRVKRSSSSWLNLLNPSYKTRSREFKKTFAGQVPSNERLVVDYSCALQKEILVHGRVYISLNYVCFYANIFKWETMLVLKCLDITALTKAKTARVIPNAIQIETVTGDKYILTSFAARDKAYIMMFRIWQNALLGQQFSSAELWSWVHYSYGDDLGYTSDEEDMEKDDDQEDDPVRALTAADRVTERDYESPECGDGIELKPISKRVIPPIDEDDQQNSDRSTDDATDNRVSPANFLTTIECDCGEHVGVQLGEWRERRLYTFRNIVCRFAAKDTFQVSPDVLFSLIFTDSLFYRKLIHDRKTYDLTINPWTESNDPNDNGGTKVRELTYTVAVNHALAKVITNQIGCDSFR